MKEKSNASQSKEKVSPPQSIEDTSELTEANYNRMLIELYNSAFWPIILKHARDNDAQVINSLVTLDPFKNQTDIARTQGIRQGLYSLEYEVGRVLEEYAVSSEEENEEKN